MPNPVTQSTMPSRLEHIVGPRSYSLKLEILAMWSIGTKYRLLLYGPCIYSLHPGILLGMQSLEKKDGYDDVDIELQCDMLFILSGLCENDSSRKVGGGGARI